MENPRLRAGVEALPVDVQGQTMVLLRDQLGYCDDSLVLSPAAAQLLMHMDGSSSLRDLQAHFMRQTGQLIYLEQLQEIAAKLDEHLFLDNERFQQRVIEEEKRFRDDPVRRMSHAGKSYPAEAVVLTQELSSCFVPETGGPGTPRTGIQSEPLLGLMAPHIDIRAGGTCYAQKMTSGIITNFKNSCVLPFASMKASFRRAMPATPWRWKPAGSLTSSRPGRVG